LSPPFPSEHDYPSNRIRCPIHGFIRFSDNERKIIDHRLFRRLNRIRQLALSDLVYPGATHTRFEHSIGVMEVATQAYDSLIRNPKHKRKMKSVFKIVTGFEKKPIEKARQVVRLAALLHDIGHAPFGHAAEKVYFENMPGEHEALGAEILKEDIGSLIDGLYWPGCARTVAFIIQGDPSHAIPQFKILCDLISGEMDSDRTDYLLRDSYHCGVECGRFDYRRMLQCLEIREPESGTLEIALNRDGIHTFEALILGRYHMNISVYSHRIRRIYDYYLKEYHRELGSDCPQDKNGILEQDDITMMSRIMGDAKEGSSQWAKRILNRKHHRMVFDTSFNADLIQLNTAESTCDRLCGEFNDIDFVYDPIPSASIHKQPKKGDHNEKDLQPLFVTSEERPDRYISQVSPIINGMPREFSCARIYADIDPLNKNLREEITKRAIKIFREEGAA